MWDCTTGARIRAAAAQIRAAAAHPVWMSAGVDVGYADPADFGADRATPVGACKPTWR